MNKKYRWIAFVVLFFIGSVMGVLFAFLHLDRSYVATVERPSDPNVVHRQETKMDIASFGIQITKADPKPYAYDQYEVTVALNNTTKIQYEYTVMLSGYTSSLIHDSSKVKLTYGENYSCGDGNNGRTTYRFVPDKKLCAHQEVGTVSYILNQNEKLPTAGIVEITVTAYQPFTNRRAASITQQISFDMAA